MGKYILGRIGAMLLTLFLVMTLSFWIIRLIPSNPFESPETSPELQELKMQQLHLNEPMVVQFYYYIEGIVTRADFGTSYKVRQSLSVFEIVSEAVPATVQVNLLSLFISIPLGIAVGIWAAMKQNKMTDNILSFLIVVFISVPSFVFASLMQYLLTYIWPILPTKYDASAVTFFARFPSMILPIIALSLNPIATIARYLRGELIENLSSDYMLLARTKGLTRGEATVKHALRNSMVPIANTIIPLITGIMGGSLVIETIYSIPGMGGLLIKSINACDHFLTVALLIFYSFISLISVLIVDISYGLIDPRIRVGGTK